MYYPGLFETASPYTTLNSRPFVKPDSLPSAEQHGDLCSLMEKKNKMVSSLSNPSLVNATLSLANTFRAGHFSTNAGHYRSQAGPADLMPYGPVATHLSSTENLAPSLLHEQAFLEASTPYGIGPLSSFSHYQQYLGNSVINPAALKGASNGSAYSPHNSFYHHHHHASAPYHSLYPDTLIPDYLARTHHIDTTNKSSLNTSSSENSSFLEHLKRLQESFQSKSPKFNGNSKAIAPGQQQQRSTSNNISSSSQQQSSYSPAQPVRPEPVQANANPCASNHLSAFSLHPPPPPPPPSLPPPLPPPTSTNCGDSTPPKSSHHKSDGDKLSQSKGNTIKDVGSSKSHAKVDSHKSASKTAESNKTGRSSVAHHHHSDPSQPTTTHQRISSVQTAKALAKSEKPNDCRVDRKSGTKSQPSSTDLSSSAKINEHSNNNNNNKVTCKPKQQKSEGNKLKRKRCEDESASTIEVGPEKIKKGSKQHSLWHPGQETTKTKLDQTKVSEDGEKCNGKMYEPAAAAAAATENVLPTKESKATKKTCGNTRRRRFRSGLDMIRNSRKKTTSKSKAAKRAKELNVKNLRNESKRLIVNKSLGETLLHRSARNNRLDVVRYCLETESCDVNVRDNAGYTPLHECSSRGNLEVARLLLEHSADVNASATGGIRPLHDAIENNHIEVVRLLLAYGADPNISTYAGSKPLQLCRSKAMCKFLKGFYSDISTERSQTDSVALSWKFQKETSENGFNVFADVPSDEAELGTTQGSAVVVYSSETLVVPAYCLMHNLTSAFYLLCDVLKATGLSQTDFSRDYPYVEISTISKLDFNKALLSQLDHRLIRLDDLPDQDEVQIVARADKVDQLLRIHSTVIS